MPWATAVPVWIWAAIMIPLALWLWYNPPKNKLTAAIVLIDYALISLFCVFCINWAIVYFYLRIVPILLTFALTIRFFDKLRKKPFLPGKSTSSYVYLSLCLVFMIAAGILAYKVAQSFSYKEFTGRPALALFPVRDGIYVTVNGGDGLKGFGMNDHIFSLNPTQAHGDPSQRYAVDFVEMRSDGIISSGILPPTFLKYPGFNAMVYSPCQGTVMYVEDGHPDVQPFFPAEGLGNKVVIQCGEYYYTLGNLRNDWIQVKTGDRIYLRQWVGMMGNSGTPSIPHLHLHVTSGSWDKDGIPVPILFDAPFSVDRFVVRNDIFLR